MERPFILTYTGQKFSFDNYKLCDILIEDIAHALSNLGRFTGHTSVFYSVAQHSLEMSRRILGGPEVKLAALLHDGAEAYVGDMSSPLKAWFRKESPDGEGPYKGLHDRILADIYRKYEINPHHTEVVVADITAVVFELEAFMGVEVEEMDRLGIPAQYRGLWDPWNPKEFAGSRFVHLEPFEVEAEFLSRFESLRDLLYEEEIRDDQ